MLNNLSIVILSSPRRAGGFSKGDWSPFEAAPPKAGKSVSAETLAALSGCGLPPGNGVWGHAPPGAFGRAAASPQTRQMRCWPSSERTTNPSSRRKRQDSLSLSLVLFPPKPLHWVSAGALLGAVIKTPISHFFGTSMWGVSLPSGRFICVGTTPRGVYFGRKTAFSEWVLCADERAVHSCTQRFFGTSMRGGITTLGVRFMPLKRWTPAGHSGLFAVFMPPRCSPYVG